MIIKTPSLTPNVIITLFKHLKVRRLKIICLRKPVKKKNNEEEDI